MAQRILTETSEPPADSLRATTHPTATSDNLLAGSARGQAGRVTVQGTGEVRRSARMPPCGKRSLVLGSLVFSGPASAGIKLRVGPCHRTTNFRIAGESRGAGLRLRPSPQEAVCGWVKQGVSANKKPIKFRSLRERLKDCWGDVLELPADDLRAGKHPHHNVR